MNMSWVAQIEAFTLFIFIEFFRCLENSLSEHDVMHFRGIEKQHSKGAEQRTSRVGIMNERPRAPSSLFPPL